MEILDILILGSGPAALSLASELAKQDLKIKGISNTLTALSNYVNSLRIGIAREATERINTIFQRK